MTNNINRKLVKRFLHFVIESHILAENYGYYIDLALNWISIHKPDEYDTMSIVAHQMKSDEDRYWEIVREFKTNPKIYTKYINENYTFEKYVYDNYPNEYEDIMDTYDSINKIIDIWYEEHDSIYLDYYAPCRKHEIIPIKPVYGRMKEYINNCVNNIDVDCSEELDDAYPYDDFYAQDYPLLGEYEIVPYTLTDAYKIIHAHEVEQAYKAEHTEQVYADCPDEELL